MTTDPNEIVARSKERAASRAARTRALRLPMPNDEYDDAIVIASVWFDDDNGTATLMLLRKQPPFYAVADIEWTGGSWRTTDERPHPNINPAVEDYAQSGGDY